MVLLRHMIVFAIGRGYRKAYKLCLNIREKPKVAVNKGNPIFGCKVGISLIVMKIFLKDFSHIFLMRIVTLNAPI